MKLHQHIVEAGYSKLKAGIIPFLRDGRCMFMVSSNAAYGGSDPAIAKGRVDGSENAKEAAIREGAEELGLQGRESHGEIMNKVFEKIDNHIKNK